MRVVVGDVKYLWELNRHGHLVTLAQAYALSGELRYAETIQAHLESWFVACPCGIGPNWSSALEPAIRLINWSAAWHLLGGAARGVVRYAGRRTVPRPLARVRLSTRLFRARAPLATFIRQ